jgi:hypothetical protein
MISTIQNYNLKKKIWEDFSDDKPKKVKIAKHLAFFPKNAKET